MAGGTSHDSEAPNTRSNYDGINPSKTWTPIDEHDEHLKEIFEQKLGLATVDVLKVTTTGKSSYMSFILDRLDFLDLQALCVSVADIPQSEKSFCQLIPKKACGKLTEIDPQIYEQTKEAMSTIARYCGDWDLWEMPSLLSSASRTIAYCKYALIELAQEKYSYSLKQTLKVIMQNKYKEKESWDCEFYNALYITRRKLKALHEAASGRMRQFDLTYQALDLIKLKVMCSEKSVEFLRKHYMDGPSQSPTDESATQPYAYILNPDLQKSIDDAIKPLMQFRNHELKRQESSSSDLLCWWIAPVGIVWMPGSVIEQKDLMKKIERLQHDIARARTGQKETTVLLENVNLLTIQFENIRRKIDIALEALLQLKDFFRSQYETYESLTLYLAFLEEYPNRQAKLSRRRSFIMQALRHLTRNLEQLVAAAEEFNETVVRETNLDIWKLHAYKNWEADMETSCSKF
ncbi:uncharacterized protein FSUBG_6169 [Fusarium subglutinans]|uniref:Uncharacterized protein n=1 Tax=Gibberella subglutinans TaxID=42677 RepID=A0A8H5V2G1_GIBSU|nr:uncharacterized protein FSUBG_6169 [Fusarium subglutinans]KAF5606335.1 hypothetical protein FSUBG_6169 [Fusarium subglutinans]